MTRIHGIIEVLPHAQDLVLEVRMHPDLAYILLLVAREGTPMTLQPVYGEAGDLQEEWDQYSAEDVANYRAQDRRAAVSLLEELHKNDGRLLVTKLDAARSARGLGDIRIGHIQTGTDSEDMPMQALAVLQALLVDRLP